MVTSTSARRPLPVRVLVAGALLLASPLALAGTWTKLANNAPQPANLLLLLPDGTVMAAQNNGSSIGKSWMRLTPDASGSYVNGTWTMLADAHDTRLYYPSQVLRNGRVFVAGGEYGTGGPRAEIYNPGGNTWTQVNPPAALWTPGPDNFYDCNSEILPDGKVLLMPVFPKTPGVGLLYDPATNQWSNAGTLAFGTFQDEATWVKLPDDSILTIDPFGTHSERYIPATNSWVNDSTVPVDMYDPFGLELGGSVLLANGQAFFLGSSGHTALYTPTGDVTPGVWVAGPDIPAGKGTPDAPAAVLVTGNVLCAVSPKATAGNHFPTPTTFYEYDPVANAFVPELAPVGTSDNIPTYQACMLCLPDGTVLYSHFNSDLYVYTPDGAPLAQGKPAITSITDNGDGSWHLVGTGLNGISEGATYGDDFQMNSNYPIVRLTSGASVWYARSYSWSSTSVQTGSTPVSTEFRLPPTLPGGSYSLVVSANGIASDPVTFIVPGAGTWTALGFGLPGAAGEPVLVGSGPQTAGQQITLDLSNAMPSSPAMLFLSLSSTPVPFKGGTLVPVPIAFGLPLVTTATGGLVLNLVWPAGVAPGTDVWYQYAIQDAAAVKGVSLSNAVQSTTG